MRSMSIRTILFDFGNVLAFFDHRLISHRLKEHSPLAADVLHAALVGSPLELDYESGRITTAEFVRLVRDQCRLTCSDAVFAESWADIFWPNEEVLALLPRLRPRYRLLLGSNTNELHAARFRRQFADAFRHFDHLVLSHEARTRKPEAAFFQHCLSLAACNAEECVFIDDLPANVAGAQACGMHGIVYRDVRDLREQLAALGVTTTTD